MQSEMTKTLMKKAGDQETERQDSDRNIASDEHKH